VKRLALLALVLALCGCGGGREHGTATLWVTRDRGAHVVYTGTVPAGLTAMQALDRKLDITTRYGGRFVQSIRGISGSASKQRDWFWYVNGIEGSTSAAEYRLRAGDIEWWDYRHWTPGSMSVPVVVGAWPKPVAGHVRVVAQDAGARRAARKLALALHAHGRARDRVVVRTSPVVFRGEKDGRGYRFTISARDALRLVANPKLARFHFEGLG
jgi:hypothetical protein